MDLYRRVWHGSVCFFFKRASCKGHFFLRTKNFFHFTVIAKETRLKRKKKKKGGGGGGGGTGEHFQMMMMAVHYKGSRAGVLN